MPIRPEDLFRTPNALAPCYSAFRVEERLLLTGHSHQAWPDVGLDAQRRAWLDAAELVDDKWERAFERVERVARGYAALLGDRGGLVTLGSNTHELVVRLLSALPLAERPRLVSTDGEFHTLRRQLDRLAEAGLEVVRVPARPAATLAERLAAQVDARTACAMVSAVLFESALIVSGLAAVAEACARAGAVLLVDAYHALGVVPFALAEEGLEGAYVTGGGYKYLQLGEGNCFLRSPAGCDLRPVITGWYSEFGELAAARTPGEVRYGKGGARFAGATFDPTSQYRAAAVLDFFAEQGLEPGLLRAVNQHQVGLLVETFTSLDLDPDVVRLADEVPLAARGGFLALRAPRAGELRAALRARGVHTDHRADVLRFGPAPYLSDDQVRDAILALGEAVGEVAV
ncbi:MAG TPA: kynureninase [Thermoanaerobaculia bacterium]|nr:kynureninase [Thermoanaerobaculia bacterium]